jgi:hypothetical protein
VDRDTGVAGGKNDLHHLLVKDGVGGHGKDVLHGRHDVAYGLGLEIQDSRNDSDFVFIEALVDVSQRLVQGDQALQSGLLVGGAVVLAEEVVKELCSRPGDRGHDPHETQNHRRTPCTDGQPKADTDGLRDDFTEDNWSGQ